MNKLSLILITLLLALFSCSSDDSNSNPEVSTDLLAGKWNVTSIIIGDEALEENDCELTSFVEFNENKTYLEQTFFGFPGSDMCIADPEETGTWELKDKTVTRKTIEDGKEEVLEIRILELTGGTLKYEFDGVDVLEDGTRVEFIEVWTFKK